MKRFGNSPKKLIWHFLDFTKGLACPKAIRSRTSSLKRFPKNTLLNGREGLITKNWPALLIQRIRVLVEKPYHKPFSKKAYRVLSIRQWVELKALRFGTRMHSKQFLATVKMLLVIGELLHLKMFPESMRSGSFTVQMNLA